MNSTDIYQTKRNLINYMNKLTVGLTRLRQKFYSDLLYGIAKSKGSILSEIARSLEEKADLFYTIKRLSRNVANGDGL